MASEAMFKKGDSVTAVLFLWRKFCFPKALIYPGKLHYQVGALSFFFLSSSLDSKIKMALF